MKKEVAYELIDSIHEKPKFTMKYDDIVDHFVSVRRRLEKRIKRLLSENNISGYEGESSWDEAEPDYSIGILSQREQWVMAVKDKLFTLGPGFKPAMKEAVDEYYQLIEGMDPKKQSVCASFIMGLQNYTTILAHHMAMLEDKWVVTATHVDMAKEILYDLYKNLIDWLETKVKVGQSAADKRKAENAWREAFKRCEVFDFDDHRGRGWVKKSEMFTVFGNIQNLSSHSAINQRFNASGSLFDSARDKHRIFVRLKMSERGKDE